MQFLVPLLPLVLLLTFCMMVAVGLLGEHKKICTLELCHVCMTFIHMLKKLQEEQVSVNKFLCNYVKKTVKSLDGIYFVHIIYKQIHVCVAPPFSLYGGP